MLLLPVLAGAAGTLLPALGVLPAFGGTHLSLAPFRALAAWPGLASSVALTLRTGILATALAVASSIVLAAASRHGVARRWTRTALAPLLAVPHAAFAMGLAFLIAPSGWLARLASPWLTGWRTPPDLATVRDRLGLALVAGLWIKETAFLSLMIMAALAQTDAARSLRTAAGLGVGPWRAWALVVLPRLWPQLRLPVMAVLAFSLSVVDQAIILGPTDPPTLAVQIVRWFGDPDLSRWFTACAAAVLLSAIVATALGLLWTLERLAASVFRRMVAGGARGGASFDTAARSLGLLLTLLGAASLLTLPLWAGAGFWRYPDALPSGWDFGLLAERVAQSGGPAWTTLWLGAATTLIALALAIVALECGGVRPGLLFVPLLAPQAAFLLGQQVLIVRIRWDGGAAALIWSHLVFVLPYVVLALADPWRALDPRLARAAAGLGAGPWRVLARIKLPLLARPLLAAGAVGFAVSAGLYLPTLFAGAGRVATLATEAVASASGADRRIAAAAALAQAALPLAIYAAALLWVGRRPAGAA